MPDKETSNHGRDPRLELRDLYAFQLPAAPERTALVLTANPGGGPMHPDAVYRLAIDHTGDLRNDIAISFVYAPPVDGAQKVDVYLAVGNQASTIAAVGSQLFGGVEVSFGERVTAVESGGFTFASAARSDPSRADTNVIAMIVELPNSYLSAGPAVRIWGRCSILNDRQWVHTDRVGHLSLGDLITDDDMRAQYQAGEPNRDRERWMGQLIEVMTRNGGYTRQEAIDAINTDRTLPDVLTYDPSRPAKYPNGRTLTDDVIGHRRSFLTNGQSPPSGWSPHTDLLPEFPYLGPPHLTQALRMRR
ncbi:MAG: DUF4331 domain-containing protein [Actinomycetia bacterium]|nr:DUF4331 domain-containing protein [Actinomycetes bacterium]MCH9710392.1 DUF4331 domain-containing protein [Actinomycetes bacterium]MCH9766215.1 DUF4331 domain-containing protein [Actinomycetes bacterium]